LKTLSCIFIISIFLTSCGADRSFSPLATEACTCFGSFSKELSSDTKKVLIRTSRNKDFFLGLSRELDKIRDEEKKLKVQIEIENGFTENPALHDCMKQLRTRHNIEQIPLDVIEEMNDYPDCEVGAALSRIVNQQQIRN
jgi:hypothetical protein